MSSLKIDFKIALAAFVSGILLGFFSVYPKYQKQTKELEKFRVENEELKQKMAEQVLEYQEKLKTFNTKIKTKTKYDIKKKEIIEYKFEEGKDECENIKDLINEYRNSGIDSVQSEDEQN